MLSASRPPLRCRNGVVAAPHSLASLAGARMLARPGSLPLAQVLAPAIAYAHDGFAVSGKLAAAFAEDAGLLGGDPGARAAWFSDGQLPRAGQVWRQPELGRTLEALAVGGRDEFYRGATARAIGAASRALGGLLDEQDLATHHSDWVEPIGTSYRG